MKPIRVLHILHSMNRGGAENALMNYYRHLDRDLVQFDFLLTDSNKCQFEDEIYHMGGKIFRIPSLTKSNPFRYIRALDTFFRSHPEYKIVHSHTSSKSALPLFIAKLHGIPVRCAHSHSSQSEKGINGIIRGFLIPVLKAVSTDWLSCGDKAAIWLYGRKAFLKGKPRVFKNVIEGNKFQYNPVIRQKLRKQLDIGENTFVIGHVARFCPVKNHLFDIEILSEVKKVVPDVKLLLVGGGELQSAITDKAVKYDVLENIIFSGIVSNVHDYEQAMDAFILPSFYEGLPLSIIEAQIAGLPCFTTQGSVSQECSITDLVSYISLEDGARAWAEEIIKSRECQRTDRFDEVARQGYDAATSAKVLQDFYLSKL